MKKTFLIALLIPLAAFAQQRLTVPLKIDAGDGLNAALTIYSTNQTAPLISANNGTTTMLTVYSNGAISLDSISLANTNSQITFGATNTAPTTTNTANTWVKVSLAGDTNVYKMPLYR